MYVHINIRNPAAPKGLATNADNSDEDQDAAEPSRAAIPKCAQ